MVILQIRLYLIFLNIFVFAQNIESKKVDNCTDNSSDLFYNNQVHKPKQSSISSAMSNHNNNIIHERPMETGNNNPTSPVCEYTIDHLQDNVDASIVNSEIIIP